MHKERLVMWPCFRALLVMLIPLFDAFKVSFRSLGARILGSAGSSDPAATKSHHSTHHDWASMLANCLRHWIMCGSHNSLWHDSPLSSLREEQRPRAVMSLDE